MGRMFSRIISQSLLVLIAVVLSYALLIVIGAYAPEMLAWLLDGAEMVESAVNNIRFESDFFNSALNFLVGEETILILIFSILSRLIIALLGISQGVGWVLNRITTQSIILVLSFSLSLFLLVLIWWQMPTLMSELQDWAQVVERSLEHTGLLPTLYNNVLRFIVTDETILVVFFAIVARIIIAFFASMLSSAFNIDN